MLLAYNIPKKDLQWFRKKGIFIKECNPLKKGVLKGKGSWPSTILSKFYLFTPEFKKWQNIIFLDADIIVRASLDELTKVKTFAATSYGNLGVELLKTNKKLYRSIKQRYDLKKDAFTVGVIAFNTDIINKTDFDDLNQLYEKYQLVSAFPEQLIFNLLLYKKWGKLSKIYNCFVDDMIKIYGIKPRKIDAVVLHFVNQRDPWLPSSPFYQEWKHNLDIADLINLKVTPSARKNWTKYDINNYGSYLRKRRILNFPNYVLHNLLHIVDRIVGLFGIILRRIFSDLYNIRKRSKNENI